MSSLTIRAATVANSVDAVVTHLISPGFVLGVASGATVGLLFLCTSRNLPARVCQWLRGRQGRVKHPRGLHSVLRLRTSAVPFDAAGAEDKNLEEDAVTDSFHAHAEAVRSQMSLYADALADGDPVLRERLRSIERGFDQSRTRPPRPTCTNPRGRWGRSPW